MAAELELIDLSAEQEERAERLHEESIVVDGLVPTDIYVGEPDYRDHLAQGGVDAVNFTVATRTDFAGATRKIERFRELVETRSDQFTVVRTTDDVRRAAAAGRVGVILGFQDSMPVAPTSRELMGTGTEFLRAFAEMGVRIVQLTYNTLNYVGAGACELNDPGLSYYGRALVEEMNDRGVLVDLSHCGDQTTMDAIEHSEKPVAVTHAGVRALAPMYGRNKTDEQIERLAENGGVIGITLFPPLVKVDPDTYDTLEATVHDVIDHIDHVVELVGVDHVGIGTDLNDNALDVGETPATSALRHFRPTHPEVYGRGPEEVYDPYPRGLDRHTKLGNLTRGLVERGYSDDEIEKILGGNFLRVFEAVWEE
jgi:membrane dipeptidase